MRSSEILFDTEIPVAEEKLLILERDTEEVGGEAIEYSLCFLSSRYAVRIRLGDDCALADAGKDEKFALNFYRRLKDGRVTPCTLSDICADLEIAKIL